MCKDAVRYPWAGRHSVIRSAGKGRGRQGGWSIILNLIFLSSLHIQEATGEDNNNT